jgi:hypothetical protein
MRFREPASDTVIFIELVTSGRTGQHLTLRGALGAAETPPPSLAPSLRPEKRTEDFLGLRE